MREKPTPEGILEFTSCKCQKTMCKRNNCSCKSLGLPCKELCECVRCWNNVVEDDNVDDNEEVSTSGESESESKSFDIDDDDKDFILLFLVFAILSIYNTGFYQ